VEGLEESLKPKLHLGDNPKDHLIILLLRGSRSTGRDPLLDAARLDLQGVEVDSIVVVGVHTDEQTIEAAILGLVEEPAGELGWLDASEHVVHEVLIPFGTLLTLAYGLPVVKLVVFKQALVDVVLNDVPSAPVATPAKKCAQECCIQEEPTVSIGVGVLPIDVDVGWHQELVMHVVCL
jgi:hypothetical protein